MITIIITDYSIKNQVFNKHIPDANNSFLKKLANAIKSQRWEKFKIYDTFFYKIYIDKTEYRAVINELAENKFAIIYYRHKNELYSKNISKYDNLSSEKIYSNYIKVLEHIQENKFMQITYN